MSSFDNPTMVMVFASTLRSLHMLRASRCSIFQGTKADTFHQDMKAIAESTVEDFERALSFDQHKGAQTLIEAFQSPKLAETNKAVYTALKHTLLQTSTVPLTEGNKMKMRQMSFSVTLLFGSLKAFVTTNFADTYSPLTVLLYDCGRTTDAANASDEVIGETTLNLFEDCPTMPTLQRMHQIVAQHPTIQARLFLLLEQLTVTELLCGNYISIGTTVLDSLDKPPSTVYDYEDCYASNGNPGIAHFMTCMLEPLEAQGRGFEHGHKKVTGIPTTRVAALKRMFSKGDDELKQCMQAIRTGVLQAASTLQYDSATLPAKQLDIPCLPECFSKKQQALSRLDGGMEADATTQRKLLEVTPEELPGHVVRERTLAEAEQRSSRNAYRCVPLTGCHQSMLPCYRSSAAVGHLSHYTLDQYGLTPDCKTPELARQLGGGRRR